MANISPVSWPMLAVIVVMAGIVTAVLTLAPHPATPNRFQSRAGDVSAGIPHRPAKRSHDALLSGEESAASARAANQQGGKG